METLVYKNQMGAVVLQGEEQEIEVSEETAKGLLIRLSSLFNWKIKPSSTNFESGFVGVANVNSTKEKPIG